MSLEQFDVVVFTALLFGGAYTAWFGHSATWLLDDQHLDFLGFLLPVAKVLGWASMAVGGINLMVTLT